jgi:hypothetical protein
MKNWKKTFFGLMGIMVVMAVIGACGGGDTSHSHKFETDWKYDETQHWRECSCGDKTEVANHTFNNGICTVCEYENAHANKPTHINLGGNKALEVPAEINTAQANTTVGVIEGAYSAFTHKAHLSIASVKLTTGSAVSLVGGVLTVGIGATEANITTEFTNYVTCVCPPENIYVGTETCDCSKPLCECVILEGGRLSNGVPVLTGGTSILPATAIEKINAAFAWLANEGATDEANFAKDNISLIRIVTGVGATADVIFENGKWVAVIGDNAINAANAADIIGEAFYIFADTNMMAQLQMDKSIRIAIGNKLDDKG